MIGDIMAIPSPTVDELREKYKILFDELKELLGESNLLGCIEDLIIDLEWYDLYCEEISKSKKMTEARKREEYTRFYNKVVNAYFKLDPYLSYGERPRLNIPPKKGDTFELLEKHLKAYPEAMELIYKIFTPQRKRKSAKEIENEEKRKDFDRLKRSIKSYNEALEKQKKQ